MPSYICSLYQNTVTWPLVYGIAFDLAKAFFLIPIRKGRKKFVSGRMHKSIYNTYALCRKIFGRDMSHPGIPENNRIGPLY